MEIDEKGNIKLVKDYKDGGQEFTFVSKESWNIVRSNLDENGTVNGWYPYTGKPAVPKTVEEFISKKEDSKLAVENDKLKDEKAELEAELAKLRSALAEKEEVEIKDSTDDTPAEPAKKTVKRTPTKKQKK